MIAYINVMIDNSDAYYVMLGIIRKTPSGTDEQAYDDIDNIDKAAVRYIAIVGKHRNAK